MANGLIKSFYIFMSGLKHGCNTIASLGNSSLLTVNASGSVFPLAGSFFSLFYLMNDLFYIIITKTLFHSGCDRKSLGSAG